MPFQIHALGYAPFAPLFALSDDELARRRAARVVADSNPGYPCRVSLADAAVGETLILVNFEHQSAATPYRACHAIYVRENAEQLFPKPGVIPEVLRRRLISMRAFDDRHYLVGAEVVDGIALGDAITDMLRTPTVAYLHLHNAKPGCFAARVTRA